MNLEPLVVSLALGGLFLWGLLSPRSQWNVLVAWTRSDPRATEPGATSYATARFISFIGLMALLAVAAGWGVGAIRTRLPTTAAHSPSTVERIWGAPQPVVVDRVFTSLSLPPSGLWSEVVRGYQNIDLESRRPVYLFNAVAVRNTGPASQAGFLGVEPIATAVALDTADFVVHVVADARCIPEQVVVATVDGAVQIGVYFANPRGSIDSGTADACEPDPPTERSAGYLVPVDLPEPLGERELHTLDGNPIPLETKE